MRTIEFQVTLRTKIFFTFQKQLSLAFSDWQRLGRKLAENRRNSSSCSSNPKWHEVSQPENETQKKSNENTNGEANELGFDAQITKFDVGNGVAENSR